MSVKLAGALCLSPLALMLAVSAGSCQDATSLAKGVDASKVTGAATSPAAGLATSEILSVDNFDPSAVKGLIDQSSLGGGKKDALKLAVDQAAANPELVQGVITQVKGALGL